MVVLSLEWKNYGGLGLSQIFCIKIWEYSGEYHCWLQMNTTLMIGQFVPIVILAILTLTLIEAAGAAEYRFLITRNNCFWSLFSQKASWYWSETADLSKNHAKIQPYHHAPGLWQLHLRDSGRLWAEPWSLWHIHAPQWSPWRKCLLFSLYWKWKGELERLDEMHF